ncbi:MAG: MmcQ/YjbR family DNA-binding protein [Steroidobacteraceae bacterium]
MKLNDARRIAMSLPEVTEEPHFAYTSFRVKGKIFATAPPNGEHLHIFVADEDRETALVLAPGVVEKLWWGGKVRGLRVALARASRPLVAELLNKAWSRRAPKALVEPIQAKMSLRMR